MFLDRTEVKRIFNFKSWIGGNSESLKYHFGRQLSLMSNGPLNSSKQLAGCELRQLETQLVAQTTILGRLHIPV
jgi:hypothetical protein